MATNFPTSLDSFTNPSAGSALNSPSHAGQHADINDAMEAVQAKLGVGSGTIGKWQSFTPTWTNLTVGNGSVQAEYAEVNEICFWRVQLVWGSTTAITASGVAITYPLTADQTYLGAIGGSVTFEDATAGDYWGFLYRSNTTRANIVYGATGGTALSGGTVTSSAPFTFTTGDVIVIEDWYKPA